MSGYVNTQFPSNRFSVQDSLINSSFRNQEARSKKLRNEASTESVVNSRYGLTLRNYLNLLTGFSEYLK